MRGSPRLPVPVESGLLSAPNAECSSILAKRPANHLDHRNGIREVADLFYELEVPLRQLDLQSPQLWKLASPISGRPSAPYTRALFFVGDQGYYPAYARLNAKIDVIPSRLHSSERAVWRPSRLGSQPIAFTRLKEHPC
jgi:hypothetical protein